MNNQTIEERKGTNYVAYTFYDNTYFDETGYRIIRANMETGYLKCNLLKINGYTRVVYEINNFYTLFSAAQLLSPNAFANLLLNIIDTVIEIKKNTFIHMENMNFQPDGIYVDITSLKPHFLYIPSVSGGVSGGVQMMENYLKQSIQYTIQCCANLQGDLLDNIVLILSDYSNSLNDIKNKITNLLGLQMGKKTEEKSIIEDVEEEYEEKELSFSAVEKMSDKLKKKKSNRKRDKQIKSEEQDVTNTTVLKETYAPQISLVGIGTPEKIELIINKKEYIVGHKKELVDGYIEFNTSVSRKHCKISNIKGKNYILDLNSANGTWVNGKKINSDNPVEITPGDKIKISNSEFMVTAIGKSRRKQK